MKSWLDENLNTITAVMLMLLSAVVVFNSMQMSNLRNLELSASPVGSGATQAAQVSQANSINLAVVPQGIPRIYGSELRVSYDDVSARDAAKADATIRKLGLLDQQISLTGADLQRYIRIVKQISCEYCCGADSIIFDTGEAACGCAHSYAMRGVAKYLIKNHPNDFTDNEILEELGKWKTLFFPGQISRKAQVLQSGGIELNYVNLASNKYRGAEQQAQPSRAAQPSGAAPAQVGGC